MLLFHRCWSRRWINANPNQRNAKCSLWKTNILPHFSFFCFVQLLQDREKQIENLKLTLRRVRDTLQPVKNPPSPTLCRTANENFDDIQLLNERVLSLEELLIQRDDQITTLRKVHDKRWSRLKHLQKQNRAFKDELQLYIDTTETNFVDFSYRKAVRKAKTGCSICDDHRWRKSVGINAKVFKQEDDDAIWNEATKLRKENARLHEEKLVWNGS